MKKEDSILDIFWKSLTISIVVGIVLICVTYLIADYPAKLSSKVVDISFIKDIYSIIFAIFAPFIAIYLFNDWKEQHNAQLQKELTLDIIKKFNAFKVELPKLELHYLNLKFQLSNPQNNNIKDNNVDLFIDQFNIILEMKNELIFHLLDYCLPLKDDKELLDLYPIYKEVIKPIEESQNILWQLKIIDSGVDIKIYEEKMLIIHQKCLQVVNQLNEKILFPLTKRLRA